MRISRWGWNTAFCICTNTDWFIWILSPIISCIAPADKITCSVTSEQPGPFQTKPDSRPPINRIFAPHIIPAISLGRKYKAWSKAPSICTIKTWLDWSGPLETSMDGQLRNKNSLKSRNTRLQLTLYLTDKQSKDLPNNFHASHEGKYHLFRIPFPTAMSGLLSITLSSRIAEWMSHSYLEKYAYWKEQSASTSICWITAIHCKSPQRQWIFRCDWSPRLTLEIT